MKLILLTLALLLFIAAFVPVPAPYESWRVRLVALGLAAWVAANYPWP